MSKENLEDNHPKLQHFKHECVLTRNRINGQNFFSNSTFEVYIFHHFAILSRVQEELATYFEGHISILEQNFSAKSSDKFS